MRSDVYQNPADDPEAEPFLRGIVASGHDPLHRLQFSDWLQENGYENAAKGQQWAAKYNRKPREAKPDKIASGWYPHELFGPEGPFKDTKPERLPFAAFDTLPGGENSPPDVFRFHQKQDPDNPARVAKADPADIAFKHEKDLLANVHHLKWRGDGEIDMEPTLWLQDDGPNGLT